MRNYARLRSGAVPRARKLRRDATDAEKALWRALRERLPGAKFRRQVPYGPYFVDFLCFRAKLIVEVDGGQHAEATGYDAARTRYFEAEGYRVIRFWNNDVLENIDGVLHVIASHISTSPSHAAAPRGPLPLPTGEGILE